jgi:hypothetical protein
MIIQSAEFEDTVRAWFAYQEDESKENWWAIEKILELTSSDLTTAWQVILALCDAAITTQQLCDVGGMPLEETIKRFGGETIDRLKKDLDSHPKLLKAAACVWLSSYPELESRITKILRDHGQERL